MRRFAALLLVMVLSAVVSACATAAGGGGAQPLGGSWRLSHLNGKALPAESPTEPGVQVQSGSLVLEPDGRFTLALTARAPSQPAPATQTVGGTYRVEGDVLSLTPGTPAGAAARSFRFVRDGAWLRLHDEQGAEYAFARP